MSDTQAMIERLMTALRNIADLPPVSFTRSNGQVVTVPSPGQDIAAQTLAELASGNDKNPATR